jgi:cephalosporin-C deacetylase-like acetyl esterase
MKLKSVKNTTFYTVIICLISVVSAKSQPNIDSIADVNNKHITTFLDRKIVESEKKRENFWRRDFSSIENYQKSVEPNRERLKFILGIRDMRQPDEPQLCTGIDRSPVAGKTPTHTVYAVRWQVLDDFFAEGLLLQPKNTSVKTTVIHLTHSDVSPEKALNDSPDATETDFTPWFRHPAADEQMFIPVIVSRHKNDRVWAALSNREYVYRAAYQLGRHIIGYEVQEILALVDYLKLQPDAKIRIEGQGDGAMLALYAAAVDTRIDEAVVVDYFERRDRLCDEPVDRNVYGLLQQFGDAEIASLVCPRRLTIALFDAPVLELPENTPWQSQYRGAPGQLKKPDEKVVKAEFERTKKLTEQLKINWIEYAGNLKSLRLEVSDRVEPTGVARMKRIVEAMNRHTARLLDNSVLTRRDFWKRLDTSSPEKIAETTKSYRQYFSQNTVGEFDDKLLPLNTRMRQVSENATYRVWQVELDVFDGLQAYGLLLVPKNLKAGERLPAVLCQHGLERFCSSHVREYALSSDGPYTSQICEHGYIAFAPQGIFALNHRFRHNQRQLNSLGKNIFAIMTAQYRQYVRFLQSLQYVDSDRIGFYGCSYGGTTAMFVPPLVPEIGATVCSANFNYWNFKCANRIFSRDYCSDWQYEIFDFDLANTFDHSDMARLIAPRPFMVERGHDDGVAYDEYVGFEFGKVRYFYDINLKMPERAEIHFESGGHFPFLTHALPFLDKWLKNR